MKYLWTTSIALVFGAAFATPTQGWTGAQVDLTSAYEYVFPLWAYSSMIKKLPSIARPNMLLHSRDLNTPGAVGVVRPNADTLYSVMLLDLSSFDLLITIPEIPDDRYWAFSLLTPYGDNLVNIAKFGPNRKPGDYLLTYSSHEWGVSYNGSQKGYTGTIKYPMAYGLVNLRILAARDDEDVKVANSLQDGFKVQKVRRGGRPIAPPLRLSMFNSTELQPGYMNQTVYEATMKVGAKLAPFNPPYVLKDRAKIEKLLKNAGFRQTSWSKPAGTNLPAAVAKANSKALAVAQSDKVKHDMGNNWSVLDGEYFGLYNSHYDMRHFVAMYAYLGLTDDQVIYPSFEENLSLTKGQSVLFTFSAPPRIPKGGFWSLTAYGEDQDLIENPLGRYSLGTVDDITYPDGTLIQGDCDEVSEFQIVLQSSENAPPSNWTSNWLPISPGGGIITTTLRFYGADASMSKPGDYVYPKVQIIDEISE